MTDTLRGAAMGCLVSKELPPNAPAGRGPSALDVTQLKSYQDLFNRLDVDGDGKVTARELREGAKRELQFDATDKECKMLVDEVSNIGEVDFSEFLTEMCRGSGPPEEVMLRRFNSVRNKLQYISADSSAGAG